MKKFFIIIFLLFLFLSPKPVSAVETTDTSTQRIRERVTLTQEEKDQKREEFQRHLSEINDTRKREIIIQINEILVHINERWTTHFTHILERLSLILQKIESRTGSTPEVKSAQEAISQAQEIVSIQSEKVYYAEITSEDALKESAGEAIQNLREDLSSVREVVFNAREAVHTAAQTLKADDE